MVPEEVQGKEPVAGTGRGHGLERRRAPFPRPPSPSRDSYSEVSNGREGGTDMSNNSSWFRLLDRAERRAATTGIALRDSIAMRAHSPQTIAYLG